MAVFFVRGVIWGLQTHALFEKIQNFFHVRIFFANFLEKMIYVIITTINAIPPSFLFLIL